MKRQFNIPFSSRLSQKDATAIPELLTSFSKKERRVFLFILAIFAVSIVGVTVYAHDELTVNVPAHGGSFTEGVLGRPGFINPVLALSDTDRDLTTLIYSGLTRQTPEGDIIPDLAETLSVDETGRIYTVQLKENITFHDGEKITSDDVVFTIARIKDPLIKSPQRASWEGISIQARSDKEVVFTLDRPYALFPENLTLGILPEHIWKNFPPEVFNNNSHNTSPIGSGPYKIDDIKRGGEGSPTHYDLTSFSDFALGKPHIRNIRIVFYGSEEELFSALSKGEIDAAGGIPVQEVNQYDNLLPLPLTRIFAVFLNQNEAQLFTDDAIRTALSISIDRNKLVENTLFGYGSALFGPLPPGSLGYEAQEDTYNPERAKTLLSDSGWTLNENGVFEKGDEENKQELSFSIKTANIPELVAIAEQVKNMWQEVGIRVDLKLFDVSDLNQEVIRPRNYDALLFGEVTGRDPDPYAFWHSSQRLDPGLNIAQYANITADDALEEAREEQKREDREVQYKIFQQEVVQDVPAIFLYAPQYLYVHKKTIKNLTPHPVVTGADRFINIHNWYIETDTVWNFLENNI